MKELNQKKVGALQEKWAASIMMHNEEYIGARQKLLSAQLLYPELDKISLMLTICDILLLTSSVKLSNNEIDFYIILDLIHPTATHSDARHYLHNLVTSIDGVKDEFPGAELALEIVENALNMLSDREKHFYNGCRHDNGLISSNEISVSTLKRCRDIENTDVPVEQRILEESSQVDQECLQQEFYNFEEERNINLFEPGQVWAIRYQSDEAKRCHRYAKVNSISGDVLNITWLKPLPVGADEKAWCNAGFPVACGAFRLDLNKCDQVRAGIFSYRCAWAQLDDHIEIYPKRAEIWALYMDVVVNEWVWDPEAFKGCKFELIEMLSDYSKCTGGNFVCLVKVNGFHSVFKRLTCGSSPVLSHLSPNSLLLSHKIPAHRLMGGKDEVLFELDQMVLPNNLIQHIGDRNPVKDINVCENPLSAAKFQSEGKFLKYKISTDDFAAGQVWAIYSRKGAMPHQYAVVNNAVSGRQVCVTILEPEVHEVENKWREDLPVACGTFKHSNSNIMLDMSQFSHLVKYVQGTTTRPHYMIYPQKGEIWAMYKNWNRKWEHTDYEICQFWMVEVISDFSKKNGIEVTKIDRVQNCLTFFRRQRQEGLDLSCTIFETEMLSFSYQVLAYRVPGVERYGIPDDSWHLEPDAIPHSKV